MPKVLKKACDRQRQDRFSREELTILAETLQENAAVVFSNQLTRPAITKKKAIWALVAQRVSAVGTTPRNVKQCRKRWDDLRLRVRSILSANMNLAMATGGGSESPIKLQPWEEICASTIGMQSIEGVGGMERGAPTSGDAGSNSDLEEEDTTASTPTKRARPTVPTPQPSTSVVPRKTPQQAKSMQGKQDRAQTATPAGSTAAAAAAAADITPIMPTEATASAASSTLGETAAIAASSDSEAGTFEESDVRSPTGHPHSPYLSLSSPHVDATQGQPEDDDWPATPSPLQGQISPMGMPLPLAMAQNPNHSLEAIATRQQQLSSLLEEHVAECGGSSAAMDKCAETVKAAIESSTKDICAELAAVRHAITDLVQTIRAMRPNEQAGSSSVASSTPSSPIRRSGRNLRSTGRGAPGASGGGCQ
ncbi:nuclear apoptosis-inducing factor 1-like [Ambystoma mexicanum]|uniref:nuclear apoptosis-inducing factor 1-like n=1 Tax=Ambystoma mexicanum TaxID=8296 RepID=UPI0037E8F2E0